MAEVRYSAELDRLGVSWRRSLRANNLSERTITLYLGSLRRFDEHLSEQGHNRRVGEITRGDVEGFIGHLLDTRTASTAATRYRGLQQFFKWALEEGEITTSPMAAMRPPKLEDMPVPVVGVEALQALLRVCEGRGFDQRRDKAILSVFIDTGARVSEVAGLQLADVDLDSPRREVAHVLGKGRKHRALPLGAGTVRDLDRYLRERDRHRHAGLPALWIAQKGAMTASGLAQMVKRRCRQAGLNPIHPHQFRHTFAHTFLAEGGNERDLMSLAGWESPQMLQRYGSSLAAERARDAHRRLSPRDRL
jgi:site-specific recombinase XerD